MAHCSNCPLASDLYCHGTKVPRLCQLIDPTHPDYIPAYRRSIVKTSADLSALREHGPAQPPAPPVAAGTPGPDGLLHASVSGDYPGLGRRLANAARAAGRVIVAAASGEVVKVSDEEQARRLEICRACPEFDAKDERCFKCGCIGKWKAALATEHCPLDPPKW